MINKVGLAPTTNPIEAGETSPDFETLLKWIKYMVQSIEGDSVSREDIENFKQALIYLYRPEGDVVRGTRREIENIRKKRQEAYFPKLPKNMKLGELPEDVGGMKEVDRFESNREIYSFKVLEDGSVVYLVGGGVYILNKTVSGEWSEKEAVKGGYYISDLQVLDDGSLAVASVTTGLRIFTIEGIMKKEVTSQGVDKLQVLDDLNIVASILKGGGLKSYTEIGGEITERKLIDDSVFDFQVLPEGGVLAAGSQGIKIYPMSGLESEAEVVSKNKYAYIVRALPDGRVLFSGFGGTGILQKTNGKWEEEIIDKGEYFGIQYLIDGRIVAGGREGIVVFKKTLSGWEKDMVYRCEEDEWVQGIQVTPDKKIVACVNISKEDYSLIKFFA